METKQLNNKQIQVLKATEVSNKIKFVGDFKKDMKMLSKYSTLVQYIKLCDVMYDFHDSMYENTKDDEFLQMKSVFVGSCINNLKIFIDGGSESGLKQILEYLKSDMGKLFSK